MGSQSIRITLTGSDGSCEEYTLTGSTPTTIGRDPSADITLNDVQVSREHAAIEWRQTYEAAIFESGRPVLLAPVTQPAALGTNIVIAWNGSTETARTIALGLPLLAKATNITVLTVEGGTVLGPTGEAVRTYLAGHGIAADAKLIDHHERTIGEAILAEADALGADLLFKGAYTHTRLRQRIFGGATEDIITKATLPVLMAH